MTDTADGARRLAIRQALSRSVGTASSAAALAAAFFGLWQQTAAQLEPVIGARGVEVLFSRALHLTARRFPWLPTPAHDNSALPLDVLQTCLAARSASEASEVGEALLLTFTGLLAGMVGESLTDRLLGAGWNACDAETQVQTERPT